MRTRAGFTLIELVMVIVIMGIMAAVALPRFVDFSGKAKIAAAKGAIGTVRSTIELKYAENSVNGTPGYPPLLEGSLFSDGKVPIEPFRGRNDVRYTDAAHMQPYVGVGGWLYNPDTGQVWINDILRDSEGTLISSY
ncbi:MAG: type II secretion system protein [Candidatus Margulisiibacteriota bacterium]